MKISRHVRLIFFCVELGLGRMHFRAKAFLIHLLSSALALGIVLGVLFLVWYRWPGWYLVNALPVMAILIMVDVGLGPLATLVIANPMKTSLEFRRDVTVILVVQVIALGYGTAALWKGRPLFYTFSLDRFEVVTASAIDAEDMEAARNAKSSFVPGAFTPPQWVYAPLPQNEQERKGIVEGSLFGSGKDVINMPIYFKPFEQAHSEIRAQLKPIEELRGLTKVEKERLAPLVAAIGSGNEIGALLFDGPSKSAVAVLNRKSLEVLAILKREP